MAVTVCASESVFPLDDLKKEPATVAELLGPRAMEILAQPDDVEFFRLNGDLDSKGNEERLCGYRILKHSDAPSADLKKKAAELLLGKTTYDLRSVGWTKLCGPIDPGFGVRVTREKESFESLICFSCNDLLIVLRDADAKRVYAVKLDFSPGQPALLRLANEAFPEDEVFRRLKEKEHAPVKPEGKKPVRGEGEGDQIIIPEHEVE